MGAIPDASGSLRVLSHSWLFCPLFGHALGVGHLFPSFPAYLTPFSSWVLQCQLAFSALHPPISWASVVDPLNPLHIPAHIQEALCDHLQANLPFLLHHISAYGSSSSASACSPALPPPSSSPLPYPPPDFQSPPPPPALLASLFSEDDPLVHLAPLQRDAIALDLSALRLDLDDDDDGDDYYGHGGAVYGDFFE